MAAAAAAAADDRFEHDSRGRSVSRLVIRNIEHSHAGVYTCQPASADAVDVTVHVLNGTVLAVATDGAVFNRFVANFPTLSLARLIGNFPLDSLPANFRDEGVGGYRDRPSGRWGTAAGQLAKSVNKIGGNSAAAKHYNFKSNQLHRRYAI